MDPPTPTEPPPPAYEDQQDFDRKISRALEHSLHISQPQPPPNQHQDIWEEWDEAKFEAAARAREQGNQEIPYRSCEKERLAREDAAQARAQASSQPSSSRSHLTHTRTPSLSRPLPTSPPASPPASTTTTKERPSWFAEAQLDEHPTPVTAPGNSPGPAQVHHLPPEDDEPEEQLPAFSAVGPSLEGPPFEQVVRIQPRVPPAPEDSPPLSPLDSVDGSDSPPPNPPPFVATPPRPRPSATPQRAFALENDPRITSPSVPQSTRTGSALAGSPRPPHVRFDPAMAYGRPKVRPHPSDTEAKQAGPIDPSAFYNSAISSLLVKKSSETAPKNHSLNQPSLSAAGSSTGSYSPRTSDPSVSGVASPYAPLASDPYQPSFSSSSTSSPAQGNMYAPYPMQQQQYPPQQQQYPQQQQPYPQQQQQPYSQQQQPYPQQQQQPYPPQQQSYPPQQQSYPTQLQLYPLQQPGYPQQQQQQQQQQPYPPQQQLYQQMHGMSAAGPGPGPGPLWTPYGGGPGTS